MQTSPLLAEVLMTHACRGSENSTYIIQFNPPRQLAPGAHIWLLQSLNSELYDLWQVHWSVMSYTRKPGRHINTQGSSYRCAQRQGGRGDSGVCMCVLVCAQSLSYVRLFGLWPTRLLCPWNSPGKNTRVHCYFLLQKIFLTQGLNPHLTTETPWKWISMEGPSKDNISR